MKPVSISVRGLGKAYERGTHHVHHESFGKALAYRARKALRMIPKEAQTETFWALKDATFDIREGENVGVIGLNGAGKSTLLKMLSRITEPTAGSATIRGRIGALLEVGTGFHPELTGRENVFMYGSILGMRQAEVAAKFDQIVEFSEVSAFIDTPVKRYSSGMYVRLAFAVAAHLDPEILFLDEVLAVGDLAFQRKCLDYAKNLQQKDATILFVSHNMFSIKTMCDRVIYVKKGRIEFDGAVDEGIAVYEKDCRLTANGAMWGNPEEWPIHVTGCELLDAAGQPRTLFDMGEPMTIRVAYSTREPLADPNFIVSLVRSDGVLAQVFSTELDGHATGVVAGDGVVELRTPPLKLTAEMYTVNVAVRQPRFSSLVCSQTAATMHVRHEVLNVHFGVLHERAQWQIEKAGGHEQVTALPIRRHNYWGG
jgi:lipopolysaccharide transport system ATP-binding protein